MTYRMAKRDIRKATGRLEICVADAHLKQLVRAQQLFNQILEDLENVIGNEIDPNQNFENMVVYDLYGEE